jgi:hypothetical protein
MTFRRRRNQYGDYGRSSIIRRPTSGNTAAPHGGHVRVRPGDLDAAVSRLAATLSRDDVCGNGVCSLESCSVHLDQPRAEAKIRI